MEYKISIDAPRIVDTSRWPNFTVEFMGTLIQGKWLSRDSYQLGNAVYFRLKGEDYGEAVKTTLLEDMYKMWMSHRVSPDYGYA